MANKHRGEHALTIGGKEYTVRLDYNAAAEAEEDLGMSALDLFRTGRTVQLREVRSFLFHAIRGQHGINSERDAGTLLGENPGAFGEAVNVIAQMINDLFPDEADAEGN